MTVRARVRGFDWTLEDASMDLGASPTRTFFKVTLPLIVPGIVAAAMLSFALSLDDFIITYFVSGSTVTYPLYVNAATKAAVPPQIDVLATAILVISLVLLGGRNALPPQANRSLADELGGAVAEGAGPRSVGRQRAAGACREAAFCCRSSVSVDSCHLDDDRGHLGRFAVDGEGPSVPPHHLGFVSFVRVGRRGNGGDDTARRPPPLEGVRRGGGHVVVHAEKCREMKAAASVQLRPVRIAGTVAAHPGGLHLDDAGGDAFARACCGRLTPPAGPATRRRRASPRVRSARPSS